jgi:hypothetical protein
LSWMAAPIPPKPAPTITASNCSEIILKRYLRYHSTSAKGSAL